MIDSHIHLTHDQYNDDIDEVIINAKNEGVEQVILIGCDRESIVKSVEMKNKYDDFMKLVVGWHPVDVLDFDQSAMDLIKSTIITNDDVIAIGEIGLDYHWYPEQKEQQIQIFEEQIKLAKELNLPIIIHCREAYEDCLHILEKYQPLTGIMHSFAGDLDILDRTLNVGLDIGISGPITFKNGDIQKQAAKACPLDKIHLETDGPYLTPVPYRGKRNLPQYIKYVAEEIAFQKGISCEQVIETCTNNTRNLFKIGE